MLRENGSNMSSRICLTEIINPSTKNFFEIKNKKTKTKEYYNETKGVEMIPVKNVFNLQRFY